MTFTSYQSEAPVFDDRMSYLCYSPELCPSTQRRHFQGYVYWRTTRTVSSAAKEFHCTFLVARGTASENRIYCGAEDYERDGKLKLANPNFVEFGEVPRQGARKDLDQIKIEILDGKSVDEITMEHPVLFHQYGRTLNRIEDIAMRKRVRTEMTTCEWIWGPTGVGKSHRAFDGFNPETHYVLPKDNKTWWDAYRQQQIVIINDFRGHIPYDDLLQMIDKWPYYVPRRGREPISFTSKHVIITSSLPPEKVYHHRMEGDAIEQLLRRVTVTHLEE